jgi:hypothetical protein
MAHGVGDTAGGRVIAQTEDYQGIQKISERPHLHTSGFATLNGDSVKIFITI